MRARGAARIVAAAMAVLAASAAAADSGLPVPRFVSLGAGEVNMRTGPGDQYPIDWVYQRRALPVEVVAEFEHWRRVRDIDGTLGWMHKNLLSGRRSALVVGETRTLRRDTSGWSDAVARLEPGVVAELQACRGDWCRLKVAGLAGWLRRSEIWGVRPDEVFD